MEDNHCDRELRENGMESGDKSYGSPDKGQAAGAAPPPQPRVAKYYTEGLVIGVSMLEVKFKKW